MSAWTATFLGYRGRSIRVLPHAPTPSNAWAHGAQRVASAFFAFATFHESAAAKMLNRNLVELDALDVFGDFFLDFFFGRRVVLKRELADFVLDKRGRFIYQGDNDQRQRYS